MKRILFGIVLPVAIISTLITDMQVIHENIFLQELKRLSKCTFAMLVYHPGCYEKFDKFKYNTEET